MDDKDIVDLYWARSERAIEESRAKYGACCRGIAFRILESREDAEECENDTYVRTWSAIPTQRPKLLGAFLCRIARNSAFDKYKKRNAVKRGNGSVTHVIDELQDCVPSADNVEKEAESGELSKLLDAFLENLPKEKRIVFVQRYWFGYSIDEIADFNSKSAGAIKMSLSRTRKSLKKHLEENGVQL